MSSETTGPTPTTTGGGFLEGDSVTFADGWRGRVLYRERDGRVCVDFGSLNLLLTEAMLRPVPESTGGGERRSGKDRRVKYDIDAHLTRHAMGGLDAAYDQRQKDRRGAVPEGEPEGAQCPDCGRSLTPPAVCDCTDDPIVMLNEVGFSRPIRQPVGERDEHGAEGELGYVDEVAPVTDADWDRLAEPTRQPVGWITDAQVRRIYSACQKGFGGVMWPVLTDKAQADVRREIEDALTSPPGDARERIRKAAEAFNRAPYCEAIVEGMRLLDEAAAALSTPQEGTDG